MVRHTNAGRPLFLTVLSGPNPRKTDIGVYVAISVANQLILLFIQSHIYFLFWDWTTGVEEYEGEKGT